MSVINDGARGSIWSFQIDCCSFLSLCSLALTLLIAYFDWFKKKSILRPRTLFQASCMPYTNRCAFTHIIKRSFFLLSRLYVCTSLSDTLRADNARINGIPARALCNRLHTSLHNGVRPRLAVNIRHITLWSQQRETN